jgi:hypothetical protein
MDVRARAYMDVFTASPERPPCTRSGADTPKSRDASAVQVKCTSAKS